MPLISYITPTRTRVVLFTKVWLTNNWLQFCFSIKICWVSMNEHDESQPPYSFITCYKKFLLFFVYNHLNRRKTLMTAPTSLTVQAGALRRFLASLSTMCATLSCSEGCYRVMLSTCAMMLRMTSYAGLLKLGVTSRLGFWLDSDRWTALFHNIEDKNTRYGIFQYYYSWYAGFDDDNAELDWLVELWLQARWE